VQRYGCCGCYILVSETLGDAIRRGMAALYVALRGGCSYFVLICAGVKRGQTQAEAGSSAALCARSTGTMM